MTIFRSGLLSIGAINSRSSLNTYSVTIDYRCNNRRFWLSAHNYQVPTPTSQNLEIEQQIRIFGFFNLQIYLPKRQIMRSWCWGLTIHAG